MKRPVMCASPQSCISRLGFHSDDIITAADRIQHRLMGSHDSTVKVQSPRQIKRHNSITCEVLGPMSCVQCSEKQTKRSEYIISTGLPLVSSRHSAPDGLRVISSDLSQIMKLQKLYPHLTQQQLQVKINCGEVNPINFKSQLNRLSRRGKLVNNRIKTQRSTRISGHNTLFFSSIDDLRCKIARGTIPRNKPRDPQATQVHPFERLFPSFCPTKTLDEPMTKWDGSMTAISPPLVPVRMQQPEPKFFAGEENPIPYELPERAPINEEYLRVIESQLTQENFNTVNIQTSSDERSC